MMNNNTQVSPRNGVDFSRIRKAKFGTLIPKLLIGGITHQSGDWYNTIFSSFRELMLADLARAKTPEEKEAIIKKYNDQQSAYGVLRPQFTDLSSVKFSQNVKDYLDLINNQFSFVNSSGINNGVSTNRYHKVGTAKRIGKDLADKWESDGYWAGQTLDRTTLGYKGDWDETSDQFKAWQKSLNDLGMETYLDTDNTYKLRLLSLNNNNIGTQPNENIDYSNGDSFNSGNLPTQSGQPVAYSPVDYQPAQNTNSRRWRFPTFPLYNAALHGIASATNKKVLNTLLKSPTLMLEAPTLQGKVTDAYAERSANEQALQRYKWGVLQQLDNTNDLGKAQEAYRDILGKELDMQMQNNKAKQDEYNQTSQNLQNVSNTNKLNWTNVANQNRLNYVADMRDRLNKIAQYQAQQGQLAQENVMANYTDWKAWNRNNQLQDYADWQATEGQKVQEDYQKALDEYRSSGDLSKYQGYTDFWNLQYTGGAIGKGAIRNDKNSFAAAYANYLGKNGLDTEEARLKFFTEHLLDDAFKGELDLFNTAWNKYQSDAGLNYQSAINKIGNRWGLLKARYNPINFTGENSAEMWRLMNPAPTYTSIYSMKKGGRFLEYLRHNRRAEKEIRDTTMKSMSESRKMLKRDLDALDRESLLLLRAIFK